MFLMLLGTEVMVGGSLRTVTRPDEEVILGPLDVGNSVPLVIVHFAGKF